LKILIGVIVTCSLAITVAPYCDPVQLNLCGKFAHCVEHMISGMGLIVTHFVSKDCLFSQPRRLGISSQIDGSHGELISFDVLFLISFIFQHSH